MGPTERRTILALHVPADPSRPVRTVLVPDSSPAISRLIGGGLLDDTLVLTAPDGQRVTFYLDELRLIRRLPPNTRAGDLATWLGLRDPRTQVTVRGDALVTGLGPDGRDLDVPLRVVTRLLLCVSPQSEASGDDPNA